MKMPDWESYRNRLHLEQLFLPETSNVDFNEGELGAQLGKSTSNFSKMQKPLKNIKNEAIREGWDNDRILDEIKKNKKKIVLFADDLIREQLNVILKQSEYEIMLGFLEKNKEEYKEFSKILTNEVMGEFAEILSFDEKKDYSTLELSKKTSRSKHVLSAESDFFVKCDLSGINSVIRNFPSVKLKSIEIITKMISSCFEPNDQNFDSFDLHLVNEVYALMHDTPENWEAIKSCGNKATPPVHIECDRVSSLFLRAMRDLGVTPKPLPLAGGAVIVVDRADLIIAQSRSDKNHGNPGLLHSFGGHFIAKNHSRCDRNLHDASIRDVMDDMGINPGRIFSSDETINCYFYEKFPGSIQYIMLGLNIDYDVYKGAVSIGEGEVITFSLESLILSLKYTLSGKFIKDLKTNKNNPVGAQQMLWSSSGVVHYLTWLLVGAPGLSPPLRVFAPKRAEELIEMFRRHSPEMKSRILRHLTSNRPKNTRPVLSRERRVSKRSDK